MGIPNITTNLSGFGCFMEDLLETPEDYGCYIVDRRGQGVEESVNELVSLLSFTQTTNISFPLLSIYASYGLRHKDLIFAPPHPSCDLC